MGSNFLRDWNWNNNLSQLGLGEIGGQLKDSKGANEKIRIEEKANKKAETAATLRRLDW